jgi:Flp pilus assembly pilin Flp
VIDKARENERLGADERGLTTIEYAIVLGLIAAVAVLVYSRFGADVDRDLHRAHVHIRDALTPGKEER